MAAPLVKTKTPGVYKRRPSSGFVSEQPDRNAAGAAPRRCDNGALDGGSDKRSLLIASEIVPIHGSVDGERARRADAVHSRLSVIPRLTQLAKALHGGRLVGQASCRE